MFDEIKRKVQGRLQEILKDDGILFTVSPDRDKVWDVYLSAFPEEFKQSNNCNCCKSFIRQYGGIVGIKDNKMITLWDFEVDDPEYKDSVKALGDYIRSLSVTGIFLNPFAKCGTDKSPDTKRNVIWEHFNIVLPNKFVVKESGPKEGAARDNKNVLERSLKEITDDAVDTVLELIGQNSLYRGQEFLGMIQAFRKLKEQYKKIKNNQHKENFCWLASGGGSQAVSRIKNSSIGTLLVDLSEGKDLDKAVSAFERMVAPANYKRPTALVTPRMVEDAKKTLQELDLVGALNRRLLSSKDLSVADALFVHRSTNKVGADIFDELKKDTVVNPKSLSKVEEINIRDFVEKVLPTAKSVRALVENQHLGNFVSLVGPQENDGKTLFKWDNNFSWSYAGGVADSIKERVKAAGGKVDGVLRISLSWDNKDDLDLHLYEPNGGHVYYPVKRSKSATGAVLDLDANGSDGQRDDPCENIYWSEQPKVGGEYRVVVHQFSKRDTGNQGFEVEIEYDGQTYNFSSKTNGMTGVNHNICTFKYTKKDGFVLIQGDSKEGAYKQKDKWGIKTGQFHRVRAILNSPNHWQNNLGNKHYMFMLEGCETDEPVRPFLNEFLKEEFSKHRKVFEVLGGKIKVEKGDDELSGIGFSETVRNSLFVEVEGKFKRVLKVNF